MIILGVIVGYIIGMFLTAYFWGKLSEDMLFNMQLESHKDSLMMIIFLWPMSWIRVFGEVIFPAIGNIFCRVVNYSKKH